MIAQPSGPECAIPKIFLRGGGEDPLRGSESRGFPRSLIGPNLLFFGIFLLKCFVTFLKQNKKIFLYLIFYEIFIFDSILIKILRSKIGLRRNP